MAQPKAKANPGETATIDPDFEWCVAQNTECRSTSWYSTPDGSFEARLAAESPLDKFTGLNYNKIANQAGEYYGYNEAPLYNVEFNEDEYYRNLQPSKSEEQEQAELNEPVEKMEAKIQEFMDKGEDIVWTPALQAMSGNCAMMPARQVEYEIAAYFQLNQQGYRKNWANTRICELRPIMRLQTNWYNQMGDYFFRFQMMRWNFTSKARMRFWKTVCVTGFFALMLDHRYARQYKRKLKWH